MEDNLPPVGLEHINQINRFQVPRKSSDRRLIIPLTIRMQMYCPVADRNRHLFGFELGFRESERWEEKEGKEEGRTTWQLMEVPPDSRLHLIPPKSTLCPPNFAKLSPSLSLFPVLQRIQRTNGTRRKIQE